MKLTPYGSRIIVLPTKEKTVTDSGFQLPKNPRGETPITGEIYSVGYSPGTLSAGMNIVFGKYSGDTVILEDIEYRILKTDDILAIIS